MEVLNLLMGGLRFNYVAIVAAAALPEAIVRCTVRLPIFHPSQKSLRHAPHVQ